MQQKIGDGAILCLVYVSSMRVSSVASKAVVTRKSHLVCDTPDGLHHFRTRFANGLQALVACMAIIFPNCPFSRFGNWFSSCFTFVLIRYVRTGGDKNQDECEYGESFIRQGQAFVKCNILSRGIKSNCWYMLDCLRELVNFGLINADV